MSDDADRLADEIQVHFHNREMLAQHVMKTWHDIVSLANREAALVDINDIESRQLYVSVFLEEFGNAYMRALDKLQ